jgi:DNA polymerase elongation subunit (family B)
MYRNASYNPKEGIVYLRTWTEDGDRIDTEVPFTPFLYTEKDGSTDGTSIFKTSLKKHYFKNSFERTKFVNETKNARLFGNLPVDQQFLIESFKSICHKEEFSKFPLKVYFIDIETYSPNEFPVPERAKDPVTLITILDTITGQIHTWGLKNDYTPKLDNVTYYKCKTEEELFESFVNFWKKDPPDILTGWNTEQFDIPYIINRAKKLLGEEFVKQLSPVRELNYRLNFAKFGKDVGRWYISGISCLDYMEIYKTYSKGDRESFSLNYIAEYELGEGKLAINATNLSTLAETDWENFVDYNIQDVDLLRRLEDKLNYLKIIRLLSYKGCTNFERALGKVSIVTGAMSLQAAKQGYIIPTFKNEVDREPLEGGYVRDPERGLKESIVSFDVNSLYPNTIITLNISSETKLGKIVTGDVEVDKEVQIKLVNGGIFTLSTDKLKKFLVDENVSLSKAGVLYSQKFKGVCPNLINSIYEERVYARNSMNKLKKGKKSDKETLDSIQYFDTLQYTLKILLNSIYGTFANKHSSFMDIDNASSITLTGQAVAKAGGAIVNAFAKEKFGVDESLILSGDTDSLYITIQPILNKLGIKLTENNQVNEKAHIIVDALGKHLNTEILNWARTELNSADPRFEFKREAIADVGAFLQKKRYILHILDDEGVATDKFKYVGVELARSTTPKKVKEVIKKTVNTAFLTQDVKKTNEVFREAYDVFRKLEISEAAFRKAVKEYEKYSNGATLYKFNKATPCHVKAAIAYNLLLERLKLSNKYETIHSGQKIKFFYALKNPYGLDAIAFTSEYPDEFHEIKIDYDKMFQKIVVPPIESVYEAIGWRLPQIGKEVQTDLFELFS